MFKFLVNYKSRTINGSAIILIVATVISKFLGIVRDWLLARGFGAGTELDIYFTAFKIPDLIYNILILGGVVVTFLPLFSECFEKDKEKAWEFASNCLNIFLFLMGSLSVVFFILMPFLMGWIAPGFNSWQIQQTVFLARIMILTPIFFGLSNIFSGILQYFDRFLIYSLCPIIYNGSIVFGLLFLAPYFGISGVVMGVVMGSFLHLLIQIPTAFNCGFSYRAVLDFKSKKMKRVFTLMLPRMFGVSVQQINLIVINAIASTLTEGSIAIFNFANNIQYFPIGVVGISFSVASFSNLSKSWAAGRIEEFKKKFISVFDEIVYFVFFISSLVFILREQIIKILLQHGLFSASSASLVSASLALFCLGIFASALIPLLFKTFFSVQDTKTPTLIAAFSVLLNVYLSFLLTQGHPLLDDLFKNIFSLEHLESVSVLGLPLAFSLSAIVQLLLMVFFLKKKLKIELKSVFINFLKVVMSSLFIIFLGSLLLSLINDFFITQSFVIDILTIFVIGFVGTLSYLLLTSLLSVSVADMILENIF